jgi:hypothetical protein
MRTGIIVRLTAADRDRLQAVVADRNSPQKYVWRAKIVLATADGLGTMAVMRAAGKSKTAVWVGSNGSARRASMGFCATRPGPRGSSRSGRKWPSGSSP